MLLYSYFSGKGFVAHQFNGKVVWITGASSSIGESLAYLLSSHGAKLIIISKET